MEILKGSYVYLLVFQIMVVSFLLLFLLWMIVRRIRGVSFEPGTMTRVTVPDIEVLKLSEQQKEKIESLEAEVQRLEGAMGSVKGLQDKNRSLKEKTKYLEQKLLEYEILQEEIGTLSYLKIENEKLRKQILQGNSGKGSAQGAESVAVSEQGNNVKAGEVSGAVQEDGVNLEQALSDLALEDKNEKRSEENSRIKSEEAFSKNDDQILALLAQTETGEGTPGKEKSGDMIEMGLEIETPSKPAEDRHMKQSKSPEQTTAKANKSASQEEIDQLLAELEGESKKNG